MAVRTELPSQTFCRLQYTAVALVLALGTANYVLPALWPGLRQLQVLDVGAEKSLPTWVAIINLFIGACLAGGVAADTRQRGQRLVWQWTILALLLAALSLDESAALHERLVRIGAHWAPWLPQLASHGWVVLGAPFALAAALFFIPLLVSVATALALRLVVAGLVFVGGALGMEALGAIADYYNWLDRADLAYKLRRIVEEGGELLGVALFNCALYRELVQREWRFAAGSG